MHTNGCVPRDVRTEQAEISARKRRRLGGFGAFRKVFSRWSWVGRLQSLLQEKAPPKQRQYLAWNFWTEVKKGTFPTSLSWKQVVFLPHVFCPPSLSCCGCCKWLLIQQNISGWNVNFWFHLGISFHVSFLANGEQCRQGKAVLLPSVSRTWQSPLIMLPGKMTRELCSKSPDWMYRICCTSLHRAQIAHATRKLSSIGLVKEIYLHALPKSMSVNPGVMFYSTVDFAAMKWSFLGWWWALKYVFSMRPEHSAQFKFRDCEFWTLYLFEPWTGNTSSSALLTVVLSL